MSRSTSRIRAGARHRVLVAAGIGLAATTAASGCAAGQIAQTAEVVSGVEGSSGTIGPIALRDVKLAFPQGGRYQPGQNARLTLVLVNGGLDDDALTSVRTDAADDVTFQTGGPAATGPAATGSATPSSSTSASASASATPSVSVSGSPSASAPEGGTPGGGQADSIPLPANQRVLAYADGPRITLVGLTAGLRASQTLTLTFSFREAGDITLVVPVGVPASPVPQPPPIDVSPTAED